MDNVIKVLALDPASKNIGMAAAMMDISTLKYSLLGIDLSSEEMCKLHGMTLPQSRYMQFSRHFERLHENIKDADLIIAETPSGYQNVDSALSYGYVIALLAFIEYQQKPLFTVTPKAVKKATDLTDPSKNNIVDLMVERHPHVNWPMKKRHNNLVPVYGKCEHMADAVAVIDAAIRDKSFKTFIKQSIRGNYGNQT